MKKLLFLALIYLIVNTLISQTIVFSDDFEDLAASAATWHLTTNTTNHWVVSNAIANTGSNSLYITNSASAPYPYAYSNNASSVPYAYTNIAFPAGSTTIQLMFDIRSNGEGIYDFARVYLMPASITAPIGHISWFSSYTAGTADPFTSHIIGFYFTGALCTPNISGYIDPTLPNTTTFHPQTITIPSSWAGQTGRLVFAWTNDGYGGQTPGAAIDNVRVIAFTSTDPPFGATLVSPANGNLFTSTTPLLAWAAPSFGNAPTGYTVFIDTVDDFSGAGAGINVNSALSYTPPALGGGITYYWRVIPRNANGSASTENCPTWSFTTTPPNTVFLGTGTLDIVAPMYPINNYSASEMIWTQSELAAAGLNSGIITHISFQAGSDGMDLSLAKNNQWSIYMGNTNKVVFDNASASSWVPTSAMTRVKKGQVADTFLLPWQWVNIELDDEPFVYTGAGNLVIFVNEYIEGYVLENYRWASTDISSHRTVYTYKDTPAQGPFLPDGTIAWDHSSAMKNTSSRRPNIIINFRPVTSGTDLAMVSFTGPADITGEQDMVITLQNVGTANIVATAYTVKVYEGTDTSGTALTSLNGISLNGSSYASGTVSIPYTSFATLGIQGLGDVTLTAKIDGLLADTNHENDTAEYTVFIQTNYDIEVIAFGGATLLPTAQNLTITLSNNGGYNINNGDYSVEVKRVTGGGDVAFYTVSAGECEAIISGATRELTIPAITINEITTLASGSVTLKAIAHFTAHTDQAPTNNIKEIYLTIEDRIDTDIITEIGVEGGTANDMGLPASFYHNDSITQSIYHASDLGFMSGGGVITHINYKVTVGNGQNPTPVDIYMANTALSVITNWITADNLQQVNTGYTYDAQRLGTYDFWIALDTPFYYTGGNLAIMTHKETSGLRNTGDAFWQQDTANNVSIYSTSDTGNYDINNLENGACVNYRPQLKIAFSEGYGLLSGVVTTDNGDGIQIPLSGVAVSQGDLSVTNDPTTGAYEILADLNSTEPIVFSKETYSSIIKLAGDAEFGWTGIGFLTGEYNAEMVPVERYTIKGFVYYSDSGDPVEAITVNLDTFIGETDEDGMFEIEHIYGDYFYTVSITAPAGFEDYETVIYIDAEDENAGVIEIDNIFLAEIFAKPVNVSASVLPNEHRLVSWHAPGSDDRYRAFNHKYNVYRFPGGLMSDPAVIATSMLVTFTDSTATPTTENYRYAVTAIYDGELYSDDPEHQFIESEPVYSDWLGTPPTVTLTVHVVAIDEGDVTGAVVSATPGNLSETIGTRETSVELEILPNVAYIITVALEGYITHQEIVNLATDDRINVVLSIGNIILSPEFSETLPEGWTNLDDNNDGYWWRFGEIGYSGGVAAYSESLCMANGECLYPDNWLITPPIELPENVESMYLTYWVAPNSAVKPQERLFTYLATSLTDSVPARTDFLTDVNHNNPYDGWEGESIYLADEAELLRETIFRAGHSGWVLERVDISEYEGETVWIAFRHAHSKDQDYIKLSDIQIAYVPATSVPTLFTVNGTIKTSETPPVGLVGTLTLTSVIDDNITFDTNSLATGAFEFTGIPAGEYSLTAEGVHGYNDRPWSYLHENPVIVNESTPPLTLTIDDVNDGDMVGSPVVTALRSNYPNPFNPSTTISFDMARSGRVCVEIFNIKGQRVFVLTDEVYGVGSHSIAWNGDDFSGRSVSSGIYFYRMTTAGYSSVRKMLLMK